MSNIHLDLGNIIIDFNLRNRITFIGGNSGTGKTYIISLLKEYKRNKDMILKSNFNIDNMIFLEDESDISQLFSCNKNLIFVDRFDIYSNKSKKLVYKKMSERNCTWIIISRRPSLPENYGMGLDSIVELREEIKDNKHIFYLKTRLSS